MSTTTTISVSLLNASTAKAQLVTLPRDMTVAELQRLAPKGASFTVDGCTPSGATTLGDLRDACTDCESNALLVTITSARNSTFGGCTCCGLGQGRAAEEKNAELANYQDHILQQVQAGQGQY